MTIRDNPTAPEKNTPAGLTAQLADPPDPETDPDETPESPDPAPDETPEKDDPPPPEPYYPDDLPDLLRGKDDKDTIDKVHKAYLGARRKVGQKEKPPGKPEAYKLDLDEDLAGKLGIEDVESDQAVAAARKVAHEMGMTQSAFNEFIGGFMQAALEGGLIPEPMDLDKEAEILGGMEAAKSIATGVMHWGRSLVAKGVLSKEDMEEFELMGGTARGVRILSKLREMSGEKPLPVRAAPPTNGPSLDEINAMVGDPKYDEDPAFRAKVEKLYKQHFGEA